MQSPDMLQVLLQVMHRALLSVNRFRALALP
jgi:hypothetical protein